MYKDGFGVIKPTKVDIFDFPDLNVCSNSSK